MENKIKALLVKPKEEVRELDIDPSLKSLQNIVEGYIECVDLSSTAVAIVNEEGKLLAKTPNRRLKDDILTGTFIIVGQAEGYDDFVSLSEADINLYKKQFHEIEDIDMEEVEDMLVDIAMY